MSVNQQQKRAMKRLMFDLEELNASPVENVSAAPLDSNMFEWHCNFLHEGCIYHLIMFFPENYPYKSPSAEFVPPGFQFQGGATRQGKKGTQICLSIFSDFADYHPEWANEKSVGWSPGYTLQNVLMNLVAFLAENQSAGSSSWFSSDINKENAKLSKGFSCKDCGHTFAKPYPPLSDGKSKTQAKSQTDKVVIIDYISKQKFKDVQPKSQEELYGYGLIKSGPDHRPDLTTPCEFLSGESYFNMKKSVGKAQSIMKEELTFFLPLYITKKHGGQIKKQFEETIRAVGSILPGCKRPSTKTEEIIMKVIPNLMSATVVEFSKGTQHTSDNHLSGYFTLHRLLLWALEVYPDLQGMVDEYLKGFIENEDKRTKSACPHIGQWLMLLSASSKYRWQDAADAYLSESWKRNVMWYVKDDSKLGMLDTSQQYRLQHTLQRTEVSRKLLAFQVLFLDIAMPEKMTRQQIIKRYDDNWGFPTDEMVVSMKDACERIKNMKTYDDWFKVLKLKPVPEDELYKRLMNAVQFAINTNGYHWSFWKGAGGWMEVLKRYKPFKPKQNDDKRADKAGSSSVAGKGRGRGKASAAAAPKAGGKGRGKRPAETSSESSDSDEDIPAAKGRGRGGSRGRGRGRGVKKAKQDSDSEEEMEVDGPRPKGRGRGAKAAVARGRGRGAKRGRAK